MTLIGWSNTIPVTGGEQYELSLHIGGEMPVTLGHGGRIRVHYPGSSADPVALWVNPANFNNNGTIFSQPFTPPTSANSIQFSYQVTMDKGRLAFSEAALSHLNPAYTITRKTYALGGQTIATRISGDQEGENGLFYIHSDHLGSTSVMSDAGGNKVPDSTARYLPFGDWRVEPGHELTDQAFTGQKHNMDLGLYYYNARFYLPGIGRFASADTIVPDPMNPQQYNRYTYTLNNPLRFTDSTGHCAENGDEACWSFAEQIWRQNKHLSSMIALEFLGQYGYTQLLVLNTLLNPENQQIYAAHDKSIDSVVTAWSNLESFMNPLQVPDASEEVRGSFANIFDRARNVYKAHGLDLNNIAKDNNILGIDKFLHIGGDIERGDIENIIRANAETSEYSGLLEQWGYNNLYSTNYEPNFLNMVFMQNQGDVSSLKIDLIVRSAQFYPEEVFAIQWTDRWNLSGLPGG